MERKGWRIWVLLAVIYGVWPAAGTASPDLERSLQEKTRQLQEVHQQLQVTQQSLTEVEHQSRGLKQELQQINRDINQLNLGVKANQLTIEKLNLEIAALDEEIDRIQQRLKLGRTALTKLMRLLQEKDHETIVMVLLRNQTLSESLGAVESIYEINSEISQGIRELRALKNELTAKLEQAGDKKKSAEGEQQTLKVRHGIVQEREMGRKQLLARTKNQEKIFQKQLTDLEKLQLAIADEMEAIEHQLRLQVDPSTLPPARPGVLAWPVRGRISQGWGATKFARRGGYRGRWHNGIDISQPLGTPIASAEQGVVLATGDQDQYCRRGAYGRYVVIKHPNNLVTLYGHLSQAAVAVGQVVRQGDTIGYMGTSGYSTGSHLHFTVYDAKTFGMRSSQSCGLMPSGGDLNPLSYL